MMQPMSAAPGRRVSILAKIRSDLAEAFPHYASGRPETYAGLFVVVRNTAAEESSREWGLAGPFGQSLGGDAVFEGWWPLPADTAVDEA